MLAGEATLSTVAETLAAYPRPDGRHRRDRRGGGRLPRPDRAGHLLGSRPRQRGRGSADPTGSTSTTRPRGLRIAFQGVPEPKSGKNRLHLDVEVIDIAAAIPRCVALGATVVGDPQEDEAGWFQVMVDPEGHEFCLVTSAP